VGAWRFEKFGFNKFVAAGDALCCFRDWGRRRRGGSENGGIPYGTLYLFWLCLCIDRRFFVFEFFCFFFLKRVCLWFCPRSFLWHLF
jgi:hypothetical protein